MEDRPRELHAQHPGGPVQNWPSVPVGGLQEEGPLVHLLGHVHIILAPDGHSVRLPTKVLGIVVHLVRALTQLGKVVDLHGGMRARGP